MLGFRGLGFRAGKKLRNVCAVHCKRVTVMPNDLVASLNRGSGSLEVVSGSGPRFPRDSDQGFLGSFILGLRVEDSRLGVYGVGVSDWRNSQGHAIQFQQC